MKWCQWPHFSKKLKFLELEYLQCLKSRNSIKLFTIHTVWKFHDFSIIQILCEIKIGKSRVSKSGIFTHLEALNFDFYEFMQKPMYSDSNLKIPSNCLQFTNSCLFTFTG